MALVMVARLAALGPWSGRLGSWKYLAGCSRFLWRGLSVDGEFIRSNNVMSPN